MKSNSKGFDLIELMIVVTIIGILAAVAMPRFIDIKMRLEFKPMGYTNEQITTAVNQSMNYNKEIILSKLQELYPEVKVPVPLSSKNSRDNSYTIK